MRMGRRQQWDLRPRRIPRAHAPAVRLTHARPLQDDRGLALQLPFARVSVPLSLGIGSGLGGGILKDVTLRLVQVRLGLVNGSQTQRVLGEGVLGGVLRTGFLGLQIADHAAVLLAWQMFAPGVGAAAVRMLSSFAVWRMLANFITRRKSSLKLVHKHKNKLALPINNNDASWTRPLGRRFPEAALMLRIGSHLLQRWRPKLHRSLEAAGALVPVVGGYKRAARIASTAGLGKAESDQLWKKQHRWAAVRTHRYLTDLPEQPVFKPVLDLLARTKTVVGTPNVTGMFVTIELPPLPPPPPTPCKKLSLSVSLERLPSNVAGPLLPEFCGDNCSCQYAEGDGSLLPLVSSATIDTDTEMIIRPPLIEFFVLMYRAVQLFILFLPVLILLPLFLYLSSTWRVTSLRSRAWRLLLSTAERAGAAFIKWGQWAAAREDLFPQDLCIVLSQLQDRAPQHPFAHSKRVVEAMLQQPLLVSFEEFPDMPVASGSIAQVYKAILRPTANRPRMRVAVKVRHPGVARRIHDDFQVMAAAAAMADRIPALKWLNLKESVSQFSHTLTGQADLRAEGTRLQTFYDNFKDVSHVVIPRRIPELSSADVLVESFEAGKSLNHFLRKPSSANNEIVALGVDAYLRMLLYDNFVHTDLHPGNILARFVKPARPVLKKKLSVSKRPTDPSLNSIRSIRLKRRPSLKSPAKRREVAGSQVEIVILDYGLAEPLSPDVRYHFISFLNHIGRGDGAAAALHLLQWAGTRPQQCPDPLALVADMQAFFDLECNLAEKPIDLDLVMKQVLKIAAAHSCTVDPAYASLVIGLCVLVGFATTLDPQLSLMDPATPTLLAYNLTGRIIGRLYG
eukprot:jgi/Chlat1/3296/Chrsp22S03447